MEFNPIVPAALEGATFACIGAVADAMVITSRAGRLGEWRGTPVHADLVPRLEGGDLASAPFHTDRLTGRVFFAELGGTSIDALPLVEVVAREIGASVEQFDSHERQRQLAIGEERIRVARDLHDGVLQSLTGVRLELQGIATSLSNGAPEDIRDKLLALERALAIEQRELRFFIDDLKPFTTPKPAASELAVKLAALRERIGLEWKVPITLRIVEPIAALPPGLEQAVAPMVHEAIVNALKHGHPSRVSVDVQTATDGIRIVVSDDGRGFPFQGRYDHARLVAANVGPVSLRERVASLGGEMTIESSDAGSRVEIFLQSALREA
jgi:signal transduction histidine kinase